MNDQQTEADRPVSGITNLAASLTSLVGRSEEVAELCRELDTQRLITLTGSGGCGKTRLAYETASRLFSEKADAAWVVELGAVTTAEQVAAEIASVLGIREIFGVPLNVTLAEHLSAVDGLVVLDNCEHVIDGARSTAEHLLKSCGALRILATSREPLGILGEVTWRVPSLAPEVGIALFVERARSVRPGFEPDEAEIQAIAEIVSRLDGIPLAIELAAARLRMMGPSDIAAGLDDRFRLLTGGSRSGLARQQTLEASVAWSYDMLDESERLLARRLAVTARFTLEAAEDIGSDDELDRYAVLDILTRLVDKSIVQVDNTRHGTGYRYLESVQHYLLGRLVESGEAEVVRGRHLAYHLAMAERIEPTMTFGNSADQVRVLEAAHDDFDVALEFATESGRVDSALRLATALTLFWELRGHLGRASRWFERILDRAEPSALRARACWGAAHVALYAGDIETMSRRAPEALEQAELFDDDWARARALNTLGFATAITAPDDARPILEQSIELGLRLDEQWTVLNSRKMLTVAGLSAQDEARARPDLESLRRHAEGCDARYFLAWYHGVNGMFLARRGELAEARSQLRTAIEMCDAIGEPVTGTMSRAWLLNVEILEGNYTLVEESGGAQLQTAAPLGGAFGIPDILVALAGAAVARNDPAAAVELLADVYAEQREHGIPFLVATIGLGLASAHRRTGALVEAGRTLESLDDLAAQLGNRWVQASADIERAEIALKNGEADRAEALTHAGLVTFVEMGRRPDIVRAIDMIGRVAAVVESGPEALRALAAAEAERERLGVESVPCDAQQVAEVRAEIAGEIGADAAREHWEQGRSLSLEDALEYISRARGERKRPSSGWASLTPTELRVTSLVAEGLTNPQVAEKMFVARGTVKVHLSHIYTKLGITNRAELAAMVARRTVSDDASD